jgi:hypothetical protein
VISTEATFYNGFLAILFAFPFEACFPSLPFPAIYFIFKINYKLSQLYQ